MTALVAVNLATSLLGLGLYAYIRFVRGWSRPDTHGDSRWAQARDLKGLIGRAPAGDRINLGWMGRRLLQAPAEDNTLVFGVQRSGKTSALAIPTLLTWKGAAVATSTKEELVRLTARHRAGFGPVSVFAPLDLDTGWVQELGLRAVTWNPLIECTTAGGAAELADFFTSTGKESDASHWYLSAANLLTALFLLKHEQNGDLSEVLSLLNRTPLNGYSILTAQANGVAAEILEGFAATPEKEAGSIISTARSSLSLWLDERVAAATTCNPAAGLDLGELLSSAGTVYLVAPAEEAERCRPLFSALLAGILRRATETAREQGGVLNPRLLLGLDEVANFARIPRLASYVSTGPGQGIQSLLCFHDLAQLEHAYGADQARTIWNNCRARLLLPGQGDLKTLDLFSRAIGSETVLYESRTWNRGGGSTSQARTGRPLRSPDGLRRSQDAVLVYANAPPARLTLRRWDQVPDFRKAVQTANSPSNQQAI
ncbi:MAG TPA: type IV secretory system conjugative DNA transfer family protein [Candidatus Solibacter sp.]|jgi:type IV secretion system protein VirD4|nr:type IV secretory system conjugative DNA transfer family protein [Candidatus Solibacter sp.]